MSNTDLERNNTSERDLADLSLVEADQSTGVATPAPDGFWRRTLANRQFRVGGVLVFITLLIAILGPLFSPSSATEIVGFPSSLPSAEHLLGTDGTGRDVLSRLLHGGLTVVWMSLSAATLGMILGIAFGLLAAYSPGFVDGLIMRAMDVLYAFPTVVMALLVVSVLGPELWLIVLIVGIVWVPQVARVTRAAALEVVSRQFVEAAEVLGVPRRRILSGEVLPNITSPLFVEYGQRLTWSISTIATLSFLGIGVQAPTADWGLMINENRSFLIQQPWAVIAPVVAIAIFTIGANLIAEGVSRVLSSVRDREGEN